MSIPIVQDPFPASGPNVSVKQVVIVTGSVKADVFSIITLYVTGAPGATTDSGSTEYVTLTLGRGSWGKVGPGVGSLVARVGGGVGPVEGAQVGAFVARVGGGVGSAVGIGVGSALGRGL